MNPILERSSTTTPRGEGTAAVMAQLPQSFANLPLWAQVLGCARLLQRYVLALRDRVPMATTELGDDVAAAMRRCARQGGGSSQHHGLFLRAMRFRDFAGASARALGETLWFAVDTTRAAEAALDFPVDATVNHSALRATDAIQRDPRVNALQLRILLAGDIDQLRFACSEVGVGNYDALPEHVFLRLAPVHALSLAEPRSEEPSWR